jgi:chaperonin cofactor prefoldin|tara:strand:+ start:629 stop:805 length:177 start_codon:yes stop_codon:yes gene_type:complete
MSIKELNQRCQDLAARIEVLTSQHMSRQATQLQRELNELDDKIAELMAAARRNKQAQS